VKIATLEMPSFLHEAMIRQAISPRLAMRILVIRGREYVSVGRVGKCNIFPVLRVMMKRGVGGERGDGRFNGEFG